MRRFMLGCLALGVIAVLSWQLYEAREREQRMVEHIRQLEQAMTHQTDVLEMEVQALRRQVATLEKQTLGGMAKDANRAMLEGWSAFVGRVQEELDTVREELDEQLDHSSPQTEEGETERENPPGDAPFTDTGGSSRGI